MAREVHASHVVRLLERVHLGWLVVLNVEADQATPAASLQVTGHLLELGAQDVARDLVLRELDLFVGEPRVVGGLHPAVRAVVAADWSRLFRTLRRVEPLELSLAGGARATQEAVVV